MPFLGQPGKDKATQTKMRTRLAMAQRSMQDTDDNDTQGKSPVSLAVSEELHHLPRHRPINIKKKDFSVY